MVQLIHPCILFWCIILKKRLACFNPFWRGGAWVGVQWKVRAADRQINPSVLTHYLFSVKINIFFLF